MHTTDVAIGYLDYIQVWQQFNCCRLDSVEPRVRLQKKNICYSLEPVILEISYKKVWMMIQIRLDSILFLRENMTIPKGCEN